MSHPTSPPDDSHDSSESSTTPAATPTHSTFAGRLPLHRSVSRASQWSAVETPRHHHEGTSYFPTVGAGRSTSPTPRRAHYPRAMSSASVKRSRTRSTSIASSRAAGRSYRDDEGMLSEEDEDAEFEGPRAGTSYEREDPNVIPTDDEDDDREEDPITVKERQSLINVEHPFGLPIWKPALYKKSRSVTRYADQALHSVPSAQAERHLLPGNIFWVVAFGWWLALACFAVSGLLRLSPMGGKQYSTLMFGLGWYIAWPFGKYVEGDLDAENVEEEEESHLSPGGLSNGDDSTDTLTPGDTPRPGVVAQRSTHSTITPRTALQHQASVSWDPNAIPNENTSLLSRPAPLAPSKSYGAAPSSYPSYPNKAPRRDWLGKLLYWTFLSIIIAPLMFLVCTICWGIVFTVPMAKLTWTLITYLYQHPTKIRFCAAPVIAVPVDIPQSSSTEQNGQHGASESHISFKQPRLAAGQAAPSGSPTSTVLLCTYRAMGWKYYKYTVGGVNILFVNLLPIVFLVILDGFILLPIAEERERAGEHIPAFLAFITARPLLFVMSLASVIPLSYFIGMAVASISAQSSIGMGAVINATFGSIIEIILYGIALTEKKGHLVEGSIVGSLLAGVLLMPGASMCSGAIRQKEMKFNAKSAGVTSMLLIMAFIGTIVPTLFYQTYGTFQLVCEGCPAGTSLERPTGPPWVCKHCYYEHPDPVDDPFYQSTVKTLMFFCAAVLLLSYFIGLWFSLRTHASQIWQNPQQLLHPSEMPLEPANPRVSLYQRLIPGTFQKHPSLHRRPSAANIAGSVQTSRSQTPMARAYDHSTGEPSQVPASGPSIQVSNTPAPSGARRISYANPPVAQTQGGLTPFLESVDHAMRDPTIQPLQLPESISPDDFTRAVAVATVSALRHQQTHPNEPVRTRLTSELEAGAVAGGGEHGGHEAPSWSRTTSASVLLACTALYACIAEILVKVVDVVLEGSGIDEKFLGVTLFALVPNTTEFMNAMSFALNGNIALSMEIGSAYALQVCLLQIPAMVAFSNWYLPDKMGSVAETFTLIFPRWDVISIILSVFLMTYTYIEAKSNYHRGSILILSYLVLLSGFYFAPQRTEDDPLVGEMKTLPLVQSIQTFFTIR